MIFVVRLFSRNTGRLSSSEKPKNHTRLCGRCSLSFVASLKKFLSLTTRRGRDRKRLHNTEIKKNERGKREDGSWDLMDPPWSMKHRTNDRRGELRRRQKPQGRAEKIGKPSKPFSKYSMHARQIRGREWKRMRAECVELDDEELSPEGDFFRTR